MSKNYARKLSDDELVKKLELIALNALGIHDDDLLIELIKRFKKLKST